MIVGNRIYAWLFKIVRLLTFIQLLPKGREKTRTFLSLRSILAPNFMFGNNSGAGGHLQFFKAFHCFRLIDIDVQLLFCTRTSNVRVEKFWFGLVAKPTAQTPEYS